jgi:hypothetical protein
LNNDNNPPKGRKFISDKTAVLSDTSYVGPCNTKESKGMIVITNVIKTRDDGT